MLRVAELFRSAASAEAAQPSTSKSQSDIEWEEAQAVLQQLTAAAFEPFRLLQEQMSPPSRSIPIGSAARKNKSFSRVHAVPPPPSPPPSDQPSLLLQSLSLEAVGSGLNPLLDDWRARRGRFQYLPSSPRSDVSDEFEYSPAKHGGTEKQCLPVALFANVEVEGEAALFDERIMLFDIKAAGAASHPPSPDVGDRQSLLFSAREAEVERERIAVHEEKREVLLRLNAAKAAARSAAARAKKAETRAAQDRAVRRAVSRAEAAMFEREHHVELVASNLASSLVAAAAARAVAVVSAQAQLERIRARELAQKLVSEATMMAVMRACAEHRAVETVRMVQLQEESNAAVRAARVAESMLMQQHRWLAKEEEIGMVALSRPPTEDASCEPSVHALEPVTAGSAAPEAGGVAGLLSPHVIEIGVGQSPALLRARSWRAAQSMPTRRTWSFMRRGNAAEIEVGEPVNAHVSTDTKEADTKKCREQDASSTTAEDEDFMSDADGDPTLPKAVMASSSPARWSRQARSLKAVRRASSAAQRRLLSCARRPVGLDDDSCSPSTASHDGVEVLLDV